MEYSRRGADEVWAAQLVRSARERLGFDVRWAAQLLGVSSGFLFEAETGMTPLSVGFCRRVIGTFGVPDGEARELLAAVGAVEEKERTWQRA